MFYVSKWCAEIESGRLISKWAIKSPLGYFTQYSSVEEHFSKIPTIALTMTLEKDLQNGSSFPTKAKEKVEK